MAENFSCQKKNKTYPPNEIKTTILTRVLKWKTNLIQARLVINHRIENQFASFKDKICNETKSFFDYFSDAFLSFGFKIY